MADGREIVLYLSGISVMIIRNIIVSRLCGWLFDSGKQSGFKALDLDDGVKANYEKIQTASDGKKYAVLAKI